MMALLYYKMRIVLKEGRSISTVFIHTYGRKSYVTSNISQNPIKMKTVTLSYPVWNSCYKLQTRNETVYGSTSRTVDSYIDDLASAIHTKFEGPIHQKTYRKEDVVKLLKTLVSLKPHFVEPTEDAISEENINSDLFSSPEHPLSDCLLHYTQELSKVISDINKPLSRCLNQAISSIITHTQLTDGSHSIDDINRIITNILYGSIGFGVKRIVRFLNYSPEIFYVNPKELALRVENLRNHELKEGFLQRVISRTPLYLLRTPSEISMAVHCLITELDFKRSELPELFLYSPQAILDPFSRTEEKFQYVYFTMGYKKHYVIARHGILSYSLDHIRQRHLFLDRRGLYQQPDKNRNTAIENPKLKGMVCYPTQRFCREIALSDREEFELFKKVLVLEDTVRVKEEHSEEALEEETEEQELADKFLKYL